MQEPIPVLRYPECSLRQLPDKIREYYLRHGAHAPNPKVHMKVSMRIDVQHPLPGGQIIIGDEDDDDDVPGPASLPATQPYPGHGDAPETLPMPDTLIDDDHSTVRDPSSDAADHMSAASKPEDAPSVKRRRV